MKSREWLVLYKLVVILYKLLIFFKKFTNRYYMLDIILIKLEFVFVPTDVEIKQFIFMELLQEYFTLQ